MNGLCKLPFSNLVPMTFEAFGIIDAFGAIFSPLDGDFFSLLCRFSRRGNPRCLAGLFGDVKLGSPGRRNGQ